MDHLLACTTPTKCLVLPAQVTYMVCAYIPDSTDPWVQHIQRSPEFMRHWLVGKSSYLYLTLQ